MPDDDAPTEGDTTTDQQQDDSTDTQDQRSQRQDTSRQERRDTAAKDPEQQQQDGKTFTQSDVDRLIAERLGRERQKFAGFDDLKKKAAEFDKLEEAKKTEADRLNDQLAAAQVELQGYKVAAIRRDAAAGAGLDPELAEYITSADPDEALAQAKKLAERLKPPEPKTADMRQGARSTARQPESRDDLIRRMTGHA